MALIKKLRRLSYLQWVASSDGPNEAPYLKRFLPSPSLVLTLRIMSILLKRPPPCRHVFFLIPPAPVKARAVRRYARSFDLSLFVETGTCRGDTVAAVADAFQRCTTIELSAELWIKARSRLQGMRNVTCLLGDSGVMLPRIAQEERSAALFWLDAHASGGETADSGSDPIIDELQAIFSRQNPGDVVLIDDARGHAIDAIGSHVPKSHEMAVHNDIIRITPLR
jgi:hypothetical protein